MSEQAPPETVQPRAWRALRAAAPFLVSIVVAAFLGAALALLLVPGPAVPSPTATPPTLTPTFQLRVPSSTTAPPTPSPVPLPDDLVTRAVLDLERSNSQLQSYIFLLKAAGQLQNGRLALRDNKLDEVDRELAAAGTSLRAARALDTRGRQEIIEGFRLELAYLRDDLAVRPENLDSNMFRLWQTLMALIDGEDL